LRYREGHKEDPSDVWKKNSMVWHIGSYTAAKTGDGETQMETFRFNSGLFYEEIRGTIEYNPSVWRRPYTQVRVAIWCGSEDMYYYNLINGTPRPTPDIPEYTNLKAKLNSVELENEAFGIFTSRYVKYIDFYLSDYMMMKYLPDPMLVNRQFIPVPVVVD
jgi:hypothetical protein